MHRSYLYSHILDLKGRINRAKQCCATIEQFVSLMWSKYNVAVTEKGHYRRFVYGFNDRNGKSWIVREAELGRSYWRVELACLFTAQKIVRNL